MKHPWRQAGTQKNDYTNPGGVICFNPGFQPGDIKNTLTVLAEFLHFLQKL